MKISTKQEAQLAGATRYYPGIECPAGHAVERYTCNGTCVECARLNVRDRYAQNPEKWALYSRKWKSSNPERYKERRIKWRSSPSSRAREMITAARWSAKEKGLAYNLDREWLLPKLEAGICELTGLPFRLAPLPEGRQNPYTASLDRIVPELGYVKNNARVILWALNAAFNSYGEGVYAEIARVYLARHP